MCGFLVTSGDVLVLFSHDDDIEEGQLPVKFKLHGKAKVEMPLVDSPEELMDLVDVDLEGAEGIIDVSQPRLWSIG